MIQRQEYLNKLIELKDKDVIKIITGIRRCGKSTILELFIDYLKNIGIAENQIIHLNLENPDLEFENYKDLYKYINNRLNKNKKNYVFIDEVQNVEKFQTAVDGLYINKNVDLYITGSNAYLLSGELATLISGRYIEIKMLPLSFKEYLSAFDSNVDKQEKLLDYMRYGSLPQTVELLKTAPNATYDYIDGVFSTIVYKDLMMRNKINNKLLLESIIKYILNNIGSPISTKKISDTLTSMNRATSNHTVENYISALLEAYFFYEIKRFDIKGKEYLRTLGKFYIVDIGLRNYLLGYRNRLI